MSNQIARIEFRAWTGQTMMYQDNQYLTSFLRRVITQITLESRDTELHHESYLPKDAVIEDYLQQRTPFKDKNGKKVYIRDIIDCNYTWWGEPIHERHVVRVNEFGLILPFHQMYSYGSDGRLWIQHLTGKFEVIGNVDENPELASADEEVQA